MGRVRPEEPKECPNALFVTCGGWRNIGARGHVPGYAPTTSVRARDPPRRRSDDTSTCRPNKRDLRPLVLLTRKRIDMYSDSRTFERLYRQFGYCFETPEGSDYPPIIDAHEMAEPFAPFEIEGAGGKLPVLPFVQTHGRIRSLGFRFGPLAYSSDVNELDDSALEALQGVECWIVDALRYKAHPSHANVETALEWISRVRPKRAILTNLHNDLDYETLCQELPPGVEPAYDGMRIEL